MTPLLRMAHAGHPLSWAVALATLFPAWLAAQTRIVITGHVTTTVGTPIANVNVFLVGRNLGVLTRPDGAYRIEVLVEAAQSDPLTLTARAIGYLSQSVAVAATGNATHDFSLERNPLRLGEVIVTGSGTTSITEKLGNTINTITGADVLRSNERNVVNAIAAKAPNVLVVSESGDPGASASIHIRGLKTITGTGQPLFVVDGMPLDNSTTPTTSDLIRNTSNPNRISDLNPNDIESVDVLKGAAAGAIYGARAGQGVILITTKQGAPGGTHYSLYTGVTIDQVSHKFRLQRKYGMGVNGVSTACTTANCSVSTSNAMSWGPELDASQPTYDHMSEAFRNGQLAVNGLSISSGTDRTKLYLSGFRDGQTGIFGGPNNTYKRTTARINVAHQFTDALQVGANFSFVDTRGGFILRGSNTSGILIGLLRTPADFNNHPYIDSISGLPRSARFPNPTATSATTSRGADNPFFIINEQSNTQNSNRTFGNLHAEWAPRGWLEIKYSLGTDFSSESRVQALPQSSTAFPTGQVISFQFNRSQIDHNLTAIANYSANPNVRGTLAVGQNLNARRYQQEFVQGNTLLAPQPFKLSNTLQQLNISDASTLIHNEGYFAQNTLDLYEQLYVTLAVRNDGSSTFSDNSRRNWFPKASAAWNFTNRVMHSGRVPWLSYAKARAAYGEVGQEPDPYQLLSTLIAGGNFCDPIYGCVVSVSATQGGAAALFSSILKGQSHIKPERTTEFEAGLDIGLLKNRADASVTYFKALSRDVIFATPLATSTGFSTQLQNAGRIRNSGAEVTLNVRPIDRKNLGWNIGVEWGTTNNRVLSLGGAKFVSMTGGVNAFGFGAAVLGSRVGSIMGNDFVRCGVADAAPDAARGMSAADVQTACANQPRGTLVIAADGFPIADLTTRQIVDPQPKWSAGLSSAIRYGKFRFTTLVDIRHGGQMVNGTKATLYGFGTHFDTQEGREGAKVFGETWMRGQPTTGPGAGKEVYLVCPTGQPTCGTPNGNWFTGNGGGFGSVLSQFVEDAGFVKLREIAITYVADGPFVRRLGLKSADLRIAGRNLFTRTRYSGWDPETSLTGAVTAVSGADLGNTPQTRSFVFSAALHW